MTDAGLPGPNRQRGHRAVELQVAARLENLAMLRTLVGAIGTFEDLDFDAVADLRLAVDEVCTRLIRSATPDATLAVVVDPRDDVLIVEASAECETNDVVAPGEFIKGGRAWDNNASPASASAFFLLILAISRHPIFSSSSRRAWPMAGGVR